MAKRRTVKDPLFVVDEKYVKEMKKKLAELGTKTSKAIYSKSLRKAIRPMAIELKNQMPKRSRKKGKYGRVIGPTGTSRSATSTKLKRYPRSGLIYGWVGIDRRKLAKITLIDELNADVQQRPSNIFWLLANRHMAFGKKKVGPVIKNSKPRMDAKRGTAMRIFNESLRVEVEKGLKAI